MSRSGYSDDFGEEFNNQAALFRANVDRAFAGRKGQAFLREIREALDAMPVKELIQERLVVGSTCCTLGAVAVKRGIDVSDIDKILEDDDYDAWDVSDRIAERFGVNLLLSAEVMWQNDEGAIHSETAAERWQRMSRWVNKLFRPRSPKCPTK